MPGPYEFLVGNAPQGASYASPLIGMALGQEISKYPEQYFQGQANQRKLAMANAFPNGMPTNPDGSPAVNQIINKGFQLGGLEYAGPLMNMLLQQQYARQGATDFGNIGGSSTDVGTAGSTQSPTGAVTPGAANPGHNNPVAAGPGNLMRRPNAPPSNNGTNDQGAETMRQIATEIAGGRDVSQLLNGNPNADTPLSPQDAQKLRQVLGPRIAQLLRQGSQNNPQQTGTDNAGAPYQPVGGVSGAPGSPQGAGPNLVAQQGGVQTQPQQPIQQPQLPPGVSLQQADQLSAMAKRYRQAGVYYGNLGKPEAAKIYEGQADALDKQAQTIREQLGKAYEETPEGKNARNPNVLGFEGEKLKQQEVIKQSQKTYDALHAQEAQYSRDQKPLLDLSRSILDDPQFYSGFGAGAVLDWNRIKAVFGNQKAAMLQEALQKVTAGSVLAQINNQKYQVQEAGANAGRIFQQQVQLAEKAAPQMGTTAAGNRFLVEVSDRLGQQSQAVAHLARQYISQHGYLDPNFDGVLSQYLVQHPLFSKEELADVGRIAPALARNKGELQRIGWQEGQPVRIPWTDQMTQKYGRPPGPIRSDGTVIVTHFPQAPQQPQQPGAQ